MIMDYLVYKNGNYIVTTSGINLEKRCLRRGEDFKPEFPDSIDLKISNRCSSGCPYCHESSTKDGDVCNTRKLFEHLNELPKEPIEIAIGGGNVLESKGELMEVLEWCKNRGYRPRITINEDTINDEADVKYLETLIDRYGIALGVSLRPGMSEDRLKKVVGLLQSGYMLERSIVYHIICGAFPLNLLEKLCTGWESFLCSRRILFLGFKNFGRAKDNGIKPEELGDFERLVKKLILQGREGHDVVSNTYGFDNLAIEQLNIESALLGKEFRDIFMGPEFSCSMYVDGVKGEYAKTSRDTERVSWDDIGILEFFKHDKTEN